MQAKSDKKGQITILRRKIDRIDRELIDRLNKRLSLTKAIGKAKKQLKIPIFDKKREIQILKKLKSPFIQNIFKKILSESRKSQKQPLPKG